MSFQLVPKLVTLNDLNGLWPLFCVISANSGSFRAHCVKVHVRLYISSLRWPVTVIPQIYFSLHVRTSTTYTCARRVLRVNVEFYVRT